MRTFLLIPGSLLALFLGCGSDSEPSSPAVTPDAATTTDSGVDAPDTGVEAGEGGEGGDSALPPCENPGSHWTVGTAAFREATTNWGLDAMGADGTRLSAVDFDGDGWVDLVVRAASSEPDDFSLGGTRRTWLLRNTGQGSFEDVTEVSGLRKNRTVTDPTLGRPGQVFAFADVDNDGDLDVYTGLSESVDAPKVETSEVLLSQGDGTYELSPPDSDIRVETGDVPGGASFVDYDRDGLVDLWVTQSSYGGSAQQDHLYKGDGTGRFTDMTIQRGLITSPWATLGALNGALSHTVGWSSLACDLTGDGDAELLSSSYGRAPNHLWQSTRTFGVVNFVNRSTGSGYAFDDRTDWTGNESARCHCQLHPTDEDCAGVPAPQYIVCNTDADAFRWDHRYDREPFRLGGNSGSTICSDVDNDGDMDLLTTEIVHWDVGESSDPSELLFNDGQADVTFARPGNATTGLDREHSIIDWNDGDMTGAVFDFDNDAWPDVYIGSSDYPGAKGLLFHQIDPGRFEAVPFAEGIDHNRSHGIAVADFDRDGDVDVVVGHSGSRCSGADDCYATRNVRFFENVVGQDGNWVQLSLVGGAGTNRAAIGARVTVTVEGGLTQTQEVGGGHGHYGAQHDLTLHFGLGEACRAQVTVRWPDADLTEQQFDVEGGQRFVVRQGEAPDPG